MTIRKTSAASEAWVRGVYRRVDKELKLQTAEFEAEMTRLSLGLGGLRSLRKRLLLGTGAMRHD